MGTTSLVLLLLAAATVAILHSILPDHWVPLAVVARTQRWSLGRVARVSALASVGHVVSSVILGGVIAIVGLQFQRQLDIQQGHLIGVVLVVTGVGFLLWGLRGDKHGHSHPHGQEHGHSHNFQDGHAETHDHSHDDAHDVHDTHSAHEHMHSAHEHEQVHIHANGTATIALEQPRHSTQPLARRLAAIAVPFGVAASPDLTVLPVALAASALGVVQVAGVLSVFAIVTIATFVGLTVLATIVGYQIKGEWLERNATTITALVLVAIGLVAYIGF